MNKVGNKKRICSKRLYKYKYKYKYEHISKLYVIMFSLVKGCIRHQHSSINSARRVLQRRQPIQQQLLYSPIIIRLDNVTLSSLMNEIQISDNNNISNTINTSSKRYYITRAHPTPKPEIGILNAINDILYDVEQRKKKRIKRFKNRDKWNKKRLATTRAMTDSSTAPITTTTISVPDIPPIQIQQQQPNEEVEEITNIENDNNDITTDTTTTTSVTVKVTAKESSTIVIPKMNHPDETIEVAINLNVDPRKPGQALRGTMSLPYGSGKKVNCIVFTSNEYIQQLAIAAGATCAGGDDMIDQIVSGTISIDQFQRSIGTKDIMSSLSKKLARILGPRGLMPNDKLGTLLPPISSSASLTEIDDTIQQTITTMIQTITAGKEITYRTEKEGIVHVPIGRASFGSTKLVANLGQIMQLLYDNKPDVYGKGKKGTQKSVGKNTKYFLSVFLSSTQGISRKIDLRTVDPSSPYFLSDPSSAGAIITKSSLLSLPEESLSATNVQDNNNNYHEKKSITA